MRRSAVLCFALCIAWASGCEGSGEGALSGTLFLRGCPTLDPTAAGSVYAPSVWPEFDLKPEHFYVEVVHGIRSGFHPDERSTDRLLLRMQRGSTKLERSDGFELLVHDVSKLALMQETALAQGKPGVPIVPPPVGTTTAPLPGDPDASVKAGLLLNNTCRYPQAQPSLRGHVLFSELGLSVGQTVAGNIVVSVEDQRAQREQAGGAVVPDVAGTLTGWFRIPVRSGPASPAQ